MAVRLAMCPAGKGRGRVEEGRGDDVSMGTMNCETMGRFFLILLSAYYSVYSYNIGCYYRYERNAKS